MSLLSKASLFLLFLLSSISRIAKKPPPLYAVGVWHVYSSIVLSIFSRTIDICYEYEFVFIFIFHSFEANSSACVFSIFNNRGHGCQWIRFCTKGAPRGSVFFLKRAYRAEKRAAKAALCWLLLHRDKSRFFVQI